MTGFIIGDDAEPKGTPANKTEEARAKLIEAMGGEQEAAPEAAGAAIPDVTDEDAAAAVEGTTKAKKKPNADSIDFDAAMRDQLARERFTPLETNAGKPKKKKEKAATLDDLINDKDKKYRRFVLQLYNAYGHTIEYPEQERQNFENALKSVLTRFSGRPTYNPLSRTMIVKQDGVKEFTANKKHVLLEKGRTLTSDKAFAMALVLSMNPKAYARGVTLQGSEQDKALLQDALSKVMALHPSRAPIFVRNPVGGQQPLPANRKEKRRNQCNNDCHGHRLEHLAFNACKGQKRQVNRNDNHLSEHSGLDHLAAGFNHFLHALLQVQQAALMMLTFGQTAQTVLRDNHSAVHDQTKIKRAHAHKVCANACLQHTCCCQHHGDGNNQSCNQGGADIPPEALPSVPPNTTTQAQPAVQPVMMQQPSPEAQQQVSSSKLESDLPQRPDRPLSTAEPSRLPDSLDFTLPEEAASEAPAPEGRPTPAVVKAEAKPDAREAAAANSHSDIIKSAFDSARGKKWEPSAAAIELARDHIVKSGEADIEGLKNKFNIGDTKARRLMAALAQEGLVERESDHKTAPWQIRRAKAGGAPEAHA